ncbi:MAG: TonB family protein [Alistipes sp.]|nr:TonB family protein [Alistipes sp.]
MKKIITILLTIFLCATATAQIENSIVLDRSTFRAVQTDALTGVNIDPIGSDRSRRPCARLKIFFHRMTREQMALLEPVYPSGTIDCTKCKVAEGNSVLILEFTAKPRVKFYLKHPTFGTSNEVEFDYEGGKEYQLEASLNQTYSIVVNSNVANADVYLDGEYKGKTDASNSLTIKEVMIGAHKLKVQYGKVGSEQDIEVNDSSVLFRLSVNTAANEPQFVVFTVSPNNAVVIIDGKHYGLTDGAMRAVLDGGTYNYTVSAAGYHSQSGTFTVAGSKVAKDITLSADAATVTLTVADNAEIWINGKRVGTGRWEGTLNSGTYIFEAKREGYKTTTLSKHITSTQPAQSYTLSAPTPIYGSIMVDGSPINAEVMLDGKVVGQLPLKLNNILVGKHNLTVSKAGYESYNTTVTVTEGHSVAVNCLLTAKSEQKSVSEDPPFTTVEQMPTFQGGDLITFNRWVMSQIRYPEIAQQNGIQGLVLVTFIVEIDGSLSNIKVIQSPDTSLTAEAVRVISNSPKWEPGRQRNHPVRVMFTMPVNFRLQ